MESIPFRTVDVLIDRPLESAQERQARLQSAIQQAVAIHKHNLAEFTPRTVPGFGSDENIDAGRLAIWALDGELLHLEAQDWPDRP